MGLTYIGIIDGNNIGELCEALERAKNADGPVLLHTFTKKGLGYRDAEENPSKYHGVNSKTTRIAKSDLTYDEAFSVLISGMAEKNEKLVAITAAMASGCGLTEFAKKYPRRFFDVGIAEEHAVTMAAGMATRGLVPVFSVYSTFLQRAYDQIVHDVCLQNLHVVFAVGHAGVTGEDGETHQGLLDLTMLSHIPNMTVLAPSRECAPFEAGKAERITDGEDVLILACGRMTETALDAAQMLKDEGVGASVVNVRSVCPFDRETIENAARGKKLAVSIEDNIVSGGMGESIFSKCLIDAKKINLGFDTCFVEQGKQRELMRIHHLDAPSVCGRILKEIKTNA